MRLGGESMELHRGARWHRQSLVRPRAGLSETWSSVTGLVIFARGFSTGCASERTLPQAAWLRLSYRIQNYANAFDLPAEGDAVPDDRTRCQDHRNQSIRRTFHT